MSLRGAAADGRKSGHSRGCANRTPPLHTQPNSSGVVRQESLPCRCELFQQLDIACRALRDQAISIASRADCCASDNVAAVEARVARMQAAQDWACCQGPGDTPGIAKQKKALRGRISRRLQSAGADDAHSGGSSTSCYEYDVPDVLPPASKMAVVWVRGSLAGALGVGWLAGRCWWWSLPMKLAALPALSSVHLCCIAS